MDAVFAVKTSVYIPDGQLAAAEAADRQLAGRAAPQGPSHLMQRALDCYIEEARNKRRRRATNHPLAKVAKLQAAIGELERALRMHEPE